MASFQNLVEATLRESVFHCYQSNTAQSNHEQPSMPFHAFPFHPMRSILGLRSLSFQSPRLRRQAPRCPSAKAPSRALSHRLSAATAATPPRHQRPLVFGRRSLRFTGVGVGLKTGETAERTLQGLRSLHFTPFSMDWEGIKRIPIDIC